MEDTDEETLVEQSVGDSEDGDSEADLPDELQSTFSRLSFRQDELERRQKL